MNKFYVESPLQLLCALPYITKNDTLVIRSTSISTDKQMKAIVRSAEETILYRVNILFINPHFKLLGILRSLYLIFTKCDGYRYYGYHGSKVFFMMFYLFPNQYAYLLDDGVATLSLNLDKMLHKYANLNIITIFSLIEKTDRIIYNDILKKINLNQFDCSKINKINKRYDDFFIGTKLVKAGILNKADYFLLLRKVINQHKVNKYILHRDEVVSEEYLDDLKEMGFELIFLKYPLELSIILGEIKVNRLLGALSTGLISVREIFNIETAYLSVLDFELGSKKNICEIVEHNFLKYGVCEL